MTGISQGVGNFSEQVWGVSMSVVTGGDTYPAIVDVWRRNWERFTPFLAFDPAIRKIIYTTNAVESLNYQLRKVTKTRNARNGSNQTLRQSP